LRRMCRLHIRLQDTENPLPGVYERQVAETLRAGSRARSTVCATDDAADTVPLTDGRVRGRRREAPSVSVPGDPCGRRSCPYRTVSALRMRPWRTPWTRSAK